MHESIPLSPAPVLTLNSQKIEAFEHLFLEARRLGPSAFVDYKITYPKHEFLRYLVDRKEILLHGSNYPDLKVLVPLRRSKDSRASMNGETIFAAADSILPMFFAVINRDKYAGLMSNAVYRLSDATGLATTYYFFSIEEEALKLRPFRSGTIYLLPKNKFKLAYDGHGIYLEEWISQEPVQVLAKLSISPEDFPLLDVICGHNEIERAWLMETTQTCLRAVEECNELQDGYCLKFPGGDEWESRLDELCRQQQMFCPFLVFNLIRDSNDGPIYIKATGPQGAKQLIRSILGQYS